MTPAEATDVLRLCFAVYEAGATRLVVHVRIDRPDELPLLRDQLNRYQDEVGSQW